MGNVGNKIKQARGTRSQEDFALMVGVDRSTLASWEIDRREPDLENLSKIADICGVSLDWLAGRDNAITLAHAQARYDSKWQEIVDLALQHSIEPDKLTKLVKAALSLKP